MANHSLLIYYQQSAGRVHAKYLEEMSLWQNTRLRRLTSLIWQEDQIVMARILIERVANEFGAAVYMDHKRFRLADGPGQLHQILDSLTDIGYVKVITSSQEKQIILLGAISKYDPAISDNMPPSWATASNISLDHPDDYCFIRLRYERVISGFVKVRRRMRRNLY